MQRRIDIGEDKNYFEVDPKAAEKPQLAFLMDDLAKSADDALQDARKMTWDRWINTKEPLLMAHLDEEGSAYLFFISDDVKNKVVLLEIWDYTLLPCRRAMSYLTEWHHRYAPAGLLIIGVHAPMFEFGKDKKSILDACRDLQIHFPVVMDNNFEIWRSLENRYWPRRVLIDSQGKFQEDVIGEGRYPELERRIQILLRDLSPGLSCPPLMKPVRNADLDSYKESPVTPEIFLGMKKPPKFGGTKIPSTLNEEVHYKDDTSGAYAPGHLYFDGPWVASQDSMFGATTNKGVIKMSVNFTGTDAYVVARSKAKNALDVNQLIRPQVFIDRKPMADDKFGEDATYNEYHKPAVGIRDAKLYHIATRLDMEPHDLTLQIETNASDTLEIFGLFFEDRS